jgi:hypothetical protein
MPFNQPTPEHNPRQPLPSVELCTDQVRGLISLSIPGLLEAKGDIDPATLGHELGVGQLAVEMVPPELAESRTFDYAGDGEDYRVTAAVCGGLHDTGKYRDDIQQRLKIAGDFGPEVRQWVRDEHCLEGVVRLYELQRTGFIPDERLALVGAARFVAAHHHSQIPEGYAGMPREQAVPWGLTHLIKYCDVLHALWYDHSARRSYQKERDNLTPTRPPGAVLDIIHKEVGDRNPVIDGVEVNVDHELRKRLGLAT